MLNSNKHIVGLAKVVLFYFGIVELTAFCFKKRYKKEVFLVAIGVLHGVFAQCRHCHASVSKDCTSKLCVRIYTYL